MNPEVKQAPRSETDWIREAWALFTKDVRAELRTKVAVSAVGIFAFSALMLLAMATAGLRDIQVPNARGGISPAWDSTAKMGMLWVLLCFAAFAGLAHSFVHEEETGTVTALRLSMSPGAVFAGKLLFNLTLLLAVAACITPVFMLLTDMTMGSPILFLILMVSGSVGLSGAATIVAALTAKARGTGALFGAVGLPMIAVFLLLLLNAARTVYIRDAPVVRYVKDIGGLLSYGVLIITLSALLFHLIWEE